MSREYVVNFAPLYCGVHKFEFKIDKDFLKQFEIEDICDANLDLKLTLDKTDELMTFLFEISGDMVVLCDRCLEPMSVPTSIKQTCRVKLGEKFGEIDDDFFEIPQTERTFDFGQLIYEAVVLSRPIRCVHPEGEEGSEACNSRMAELIDSCREEQTTETDPRWDILKQIKFD